jgi:hypothetical protein
VLLCMLEAVEGRFCLFAGGAGGCVLCETRCRHSDMEALASVRPAQCGPK